MRSHWKWFNMHADEEITLKYSFGHVLGNWCNHVTDLSLHHKKANNGIHSSHLFHNWSWYPTNNMTYCKNKKYDAQSPCIDDSFLKMNVSLPHTHPQLTQWVTHVRSCDPDLTQMNVCTLSRLMGALPHCFREWHVRHLPWERRGWKYRTEKKKLRKTTKRQYNEIENWELMENSTKYKRARERKKIQKDG